LLAGPHKLSLMSILCIGDKNVQYAKPREVTTQCCNCLPGSETLFPVAKRLALECHQNTYETESEQWCFNAKWNFLSATVYNLTSVLR